MNYYTFHLGDYAAHTAHLEPMEDLAYRRMLDLYYMREDSLPSDPQEVARLIRMRQNKAEVESVLREFFTETDDGWRHARCDEEITRMQDKQAKAKASAAASVKSRQANAQRTLNERSTDVELPTPTPTPTPTPIPKEVNPQSLRDCPPQDSAQPKKKSTGVTLTQWLADVKSKGEKIVSDYKPVWAYCEKVGIPADWIEIAWLRFHDRYTNDEKGKRKRYTDWRGVFLRAVEENWLGLWFWSERDGQFRLSTVGVAADMATKEAA